MPFKPLSVEQQQKASRRVLIIGPPNSRKTTSLGTFPRPTHIMAYPGEKGSSSIPNEPGISAYVWEQDDNLAPTRVWKEVQEETKKIISGAHGPITTFAGDGLHKLYGYIYETSLKELVDAFPNSDQEKLAGRAYGRAHKQFLDYLTMVNQSSIQNVVFTCWSGAEKDNPDDNKSKSHIWPDLPGQLARWILGEFSVVVFAEVGLPNAAGVSEAYWQLRPAGAVWGVGVKGQVSVVSKLPARVPQDWSKLEPLLLAAGA